MHDSSSNLLALSHAWVNQKILGNLLYPESFPVLSINDIGSFPGVEHHSLVDQDQGTVSKRLAIATGLHFL